MVNKTEKAVDEVIQEGLVYLRERGYSKHSIAPHRAHWRLFLKYALKRGEQRYTQSLVDCFLKSLPAPHGPEWHKSRTIPRSMRILSEFAAFGHHRQKMSAPPPALPIFMEAALADIAKFAERELQWAERTIASRLYWMRRFLLFLLSQRVIRTWSDVTVADLPAYIKSMKTFKGHSRSTAVNAVKASLRVLFVQGILPTPLHERTPPLFTPRDAILPTIWRPFEIDAVLASVDRSTTVGKRDYVLLLLALRLGLRPSDIRALRLDNICWERSAIKLVQQKTGTFLQLPLSTEIGTALIDYLRHGRPNVSFREIFLRSLAPHTPFRKGAPLYEVVQRYRNKAGLPRMPRTGMRSLRHTLATRLLEGGTALDTIAEVLGHASVETTRRYLRVDLPSLRQAALDPEEEVSHA